MFFLCCPIASADMRATEMYMDKDLLPKYTRGVKVYTNFMKAMHGLVAQRITKIEDVPPSKQRQLEDSLTNLAGLSHDLCFGTKKLTSMAKADVKAAMASKAVVKKDVQRLTGEKISAKKATEIEKGRLNRAKEDKALVSERLAAADMELKDAQRKTDEAKCRRRRDDAAPADTPADVPAAANPADASEKDAAAPAAGADYAAPAAGADAVTPAAGADAAAPAAADAVADAAAGDATPAPGDGATGGPDAFGVTGAAGDQTGAGIASVSDASNAAELLGGGDADGTGDGNETSPAEPQLPSSDEKPSPVFSGLKNAACRIKNLVAKTEEKAEAKENQIKDKLNASQAELEEAEKAETNFLRNLSGLREQTAEKTSELNKRTMDLIEAQKEERKAIKLMNEVRLFQTRVANIQLNLNKDLRTLDEKIPGIVTVMEDINRSFVGFQSFRNSTDEKVEVPDLKPLQDMADNMTTLEEAEDKDL